MSDVPMWADRIVRTVAREQRRRVPEIVWRNSTRSYKTSGSYCDNRITIFAGYNAASKRLTLLHELAHWCVGGFHSLEFWTKAFQLYRQFRVPLGTALREEAAYRHGAIAGYWAGRSNQGRRPTTHVEIVTRVSAGPPS
jgi:hypothetical protein